MTVRQNRYSVPVGLVGLRVLAGSAPGRSSSAHDGEQVARHDGLAGRFGVCAELDHYLELLVHKPGRSAGRWRCTSSVSAAAGRSCFDELWTALTERYGPSEAARQMVDVLLLAREHGAGSGRARGPRRARRRRARRPRGRRPGPPRGERPRTHAGDRGPARTTGRRSAFPEPTLERLRPAARDGGDPVSVPAKVQAMEGADRRARRRAQTPDRPPPVPAAGRGSDPRPADPDRVLGRAARGRGHRAGRAPRATPADRRAVPADQTTRGLPVRREPEGPAGHDRRARPGTWIDDRESIILLGDSGTGKTHLAISLAVLACQQGRRVRFTTLAALANELQAAETRRELGRVIARYSRTELVCLDELGYLALPAGAAELVFQVISERNERASMIVTTNLPFGEWTKVFPDARLAKAVVDRLTHRAHIIDTGNESWRFRHGLERDKPRKEPDPPPEGAHAPIATTPRATRSTFVTTGASSVPPTNQATSTPTTTDGRWGHFKRPRRGQRRRPRRIRPAGGLSWSRRTDRACGVCRAHRSPPCAEASPRSRPAAGG